MNIRNLLVGIALTLTTLSALAGGVSLRFTHQCPASADIYPGTVRDTYWFRAFAA